MLGVFAAGFSEFDDGGVDLLFFELFHDGLFDGEAVVVVAGDIGGAFAHHGLAFDDEVFEDFVEGGADVDRAVGVGGAVVEDVDGGVLAVLLDEVVDTDFVPVFLHLGLSFDEVGLHGDAEFRVGEVQGVLEVHGEGGSLPVRVGGGLGRICFGISFKVGLEWKDEGVGSIVGGFTSWFVWLRGGRYGGCGSWC